MFTQDAGDQEVEPVCPLAGERHGGGARHVLPGHCQLTPLPQHNVRYHGIRKLYRGWVGKIIVHKTAGYQNYEYKPARMTIHT